MKLVRYETAAGDVIPAVLVADTARDVRAIVPDYTPETLSPDLIDRLRGVGPATLPALDLQGMRLTAPVARPRTIWCVGLNYSDHAAEAGMPVPSEPILFSKASAAFCGPDVEVPYGPHTSKLDWEVELGVIIGKPGLNIPEAEAMTHVAGFTLVNDLSERSWQIDRGGQWIKGKSYPNFCPTGPWLVTPDMLGDPQAIDLWLDVNGTRRQAGSTATMVFGVAHIVSYISRFALLEAGDLICTGTPPGVGMGQTPQVFLQPGDRIVLGATGLGQQHQRVVAQT